MKKVARAEVMQYGIPPKHFGVNSARLQGKDESGPLDSLYIGPNGPVGRQQRDQAGRHLGRQLLTAGGTGRSERWSRSLG